MTCLDDIPEFSLIISTFGPAERLREVLVSILEQSYGSFEVIVVDQNNTNHVHRITEEFIKIGKFNYIKSQVGLSKGRNAGLALARGRIVGFPDDDCQYPVTLLTDVKARFLNYHNASGICVRCCDYDGQDSAGRSDRKSGLVTKSNVWRRAVSIGTFLKSDVVKKVGTFDENIGLGSGTPYQSGEETDLLLRAIFCGYKIYYDPNINVIHPRNSQRITLDHINRSYAYGLGKGLLLRRYKYRKREVALHCTKPLLGALLAISNGNLGLARLRCARAKGRFDGWRSSMPLVLAR